jgi:esterase/lipase superfamily enzyme
MNVEHHRWWSPSLGQDMELKVYGYFGKPVLVFPAQGGRFFEYEDFHMIDAVASFIESGHVKMFTVDSVDNQSWADFGTHPADRARRHEAYDSYIVREVVPFIAQHCGGGGQGVVATGCSMGGYHAANAFFRHPDVFDAMISLSGLFQLRSFIGDYMDETVYLNTPLAFLPELTDPWYLERYRRSAIIVGVGQGAWEEPMLEDTRALQSVLDAKGIPCWIDVWGADVDHDWPWWRRMMPYFLDSLHLPPFTF